jgi:hypothetical protein
MSERERKHEWVSNPAFTRMTGIKKVCMACGQPSNTAGKECPESGGEAGLDPMSPEMSIFMPDCPHGRPFGSRCEDCIALGKRDAKRYAAMHREGLDIRSATDLVGQCPGCFSLHSVPPEMDWECDCGEAVTIIDLRARRKPIDPPPLVADCDDVNHHLGPHYHRVEP